jgi:hypothetical protein
MNRLPDDIFGCGPVLYVQENTSEGLAAVKLFEDAKVPFTQNPSDKKTTAMFGRERFEGLERIKELVGMLQAAASKQAEIERNRKLPQNTSRVADKPRKKPDWAREEWKPWKK